MAENLTAGLDRTRGHGHFGARLLVGAGAVAAAIAAVLAYLFWPAQVRSGPMASYGENGVAFHATVGQHTTWGITALQNNGRRTIVLDRMTVKATDPRLVGRIEVAGPNRDLDTMDASYSFPPKPFGGLHLPIVPFRGATIAAGKLTYAEVEVVAPRKARFTLGPVTVYYHVGDTNYRIMLPSYEIVCARAAHHASRLVRDARWAEQPRRRRHRLLRRRLTLSLRETRALNQLRPPPVGQYCVTRPKRTSDRDRRSATAEEVPTMLNHTVELIPNSFQHVATSRVASSVPFPIVRDRRPKGSAGTAAYGAGRPEAGTTMTGSVALVGVAGFGGMGVLPRGGAVS